MKIKKFLDTLDYYYSNGIDKKEKYLCKFFAQATTFSFEIHKSDEAFTLSSLLFKSKIYDWWITDKKVRKQIIKDIKKYVWYTKKKDILMEESMQR